MNKIWLVILILVVILILLLSVMSCKREKYIQNRITISLCVPCFPPHEKFLPELIENVNKQTRAPEEIVISLSERSKVYAKSIQKELQDLTDISIKIISIAGKAFAGENRNKAASNAKSKILSFMDADDKMHPKRLELIELLFENRDIHALLHMYTTNLFDNNVYFDPEKIIGQDEVYNEHINEREVRLKRWDYTWNPSLNSYIGLHHGHLSILASSYKAIKQSRKHRRGQDALFVRKILNRYNRGVIIYKEPLSKYIPWEQKMSIK